MLCLQVVCIVVGVFNVCFLLEIIVSVKQVQDVVVVDIYFYVGIEVIWDLGLFGVVESVQLSVQVFVGNVEVLCNVVQVVVIVDVVCSYLDLIVVQVQQDLLV